MGIGRRSFAEETLEGDLVKANFHTILCATTMLSLLQANFRVTKISLIQHCCAVRHQTSGIDGDDGVNEHSDQVINALVRS